MSSGRHSLLSHRKKRIAQRNAVVTVFVRRGSQSATRLHIRRLSELRPPTIRRSTSSVGGGFVAVDVIAAVVRILLLLRLRTTKIHRYPPPPPPPLSSSSQSSIHGLREVVVSDVIAPPTLVVVNGSRPSVPLNVVDQHSTRCLRGLNRQKVGRMRMVVGRRHRPRTPDQPRHQVLMCVHVDLPTLEQYRKSTCRTYH
jgi:hypothetical protein